MAREKFTYSMSLVAAQCLVNTLFAVLFIFVQQKTESSNSPGHRTQKDKTSHVFYFCSAFSYLTAMVASNRSLQHVSYPTQVIAKSCKPIPVMIIGVLYARKRYPLLKYLFVFLIVLGVGIFMYNPNKLVGGGGNQDASSSFVFAGEALLLLSLAMDGFTGAFQVICN